MELGLHTFLSGVWRVIHRLMAAQVRSKNFSLRTSPVPASSCSMSKPDTSWRRASLRALCSLNNPIATAGHDRYWSERGAGETPSSPLPAAIILASIDNRELCFAAATCSNLVVHFTLFLQVALRTTVLFGVATGELLRAAWAEW